MTGLHGPDRRLASRLLLAAVLTHNLEEGLTYAATRPAAQSLAQSILPAARLPTPSAFHAALAVLSAGLTALLLWAGSTRRARTGAAVIRGVAAVFLANVMIPHVPAAIALGGYAPGVVTAVAVNLPLCAWLIWRWRPEASGG